MSLVIVKVDKENNKHTIYSDIRMTGGTNITSANKINKYTFTDNSILVGGTGCSISANYMRNKIIPEFMKANPIDDLKNLKKAEQNCFIMSETYKKLYDEFVSKFCSNDKADNDCTILISANGLLYKVTRYEDTTVGCEFCPYDDFVAIGCGKDEAVCLNDHNASIEEIYGIISKHCNAISSDFVSLEGEIDMKTNLINILQIEYPFSKQ